MNTTSNPALDPRIGAGAPWPPGPSFIRRAITGQIFRSSTIGFLRQNAALYGDLVHFRAAGRHVFQLNHPALVQEMLVRDALHQHRGIVMQRARFVLGDGLLTSEEPLHLRQRGVTAPARAEPMGVAGKPHVEVRIKQHAHHLCHGMFAELFLGPARRVSALPIGTV